MQDFYLRQGRGNRGCLRLVVVLVVLGVLGAGGVTLQRRRAARRADLEFERQLALELGEEVTEAPERDRAREAAKADERAPAREVRPPLHDPSRPDPGPVLLPDMERLFDEGDYTSVRELGFRILDVSADRAVRDRAEDLLGKAHIQMVFSPYPMPEKVEHTVQRGDTLAVLARRHGTTVPLIQRGNRISGHLIRVGDRLRIFSGSFSVVVDKTANDLVLKMNDRFFKRYRVGTGEYAKTPEGEFKITDRMAKPTWWRPDGRRIPYGDPENLLGTHWLSLDIQGYGLHGTWEPETIGHQASAGCVRLLNEDIEELYILLPIGTPVTIHN